MCRHSDAHVACDGAGQAPAEMIFHKHYSCSLSCCRGCSGGISNVSVWQSAANANKKKLYKFKDTFSILTYSTTLSAGKLLEQLIATRAMIILLSATPKSFVAHRTVKSLWSCGYVVNSANIPGVTRLHIVLLFLRRIFIFTWFRWLSC